MLLQPWIEHRWRQAARRCHPADVLLRPLSWLYGSALRTRRWLYAQGLLATHALPVPTVVIGNVIAGGAGKTPLTIALVQALQAQGVRVGVISRGHGRQRPPQGPDCLQVLPDSSAQTVGDEPLLIQQRTQAPVFVASQRHAAGQALLAAYPDTELLLCDDGLQHLALQRDVELCVFPDWGAGNGRLLPAGPLREPWPRPADFVLQTTPTAQPVAGNRHSPHTVWPIVRQLAGHAINGHGQRLPLHHWQTPPAQDADPPPLAAVAGIAQPEAFFAMLRAHGLKPSHCIALPDHAHFVPLPTALAHWPRHAPLLCTEKDAVKLWPHWPEAWAVPLQLQLPAALPAAVLALARQRFAARSRHRNDATAR
ncbi:tetraacyldisaccharide 4'-kinase [Vandammella animalimorsus]|uniref:tetraacyldisaccharide 4'-kinase n=1 Tax=Vandammella animalimorsus TaxID=2029117 RepID=UPI0031BB0B88